ncbi:hypothetical protein MHYP_G00173320 [Metynnis hypsauchen]
MERMLVLDPDGCVSAAEALELPMFSFREPEEETEVLPYDHSMDNTPSGAVETSHLYRDPLLPESTHRAQRLQRDFSLSAQGFLSCFICH